MSYEHDEIRRIARAEREAAWESAKRLPARVGDTASAFAKQHPVIAAGGAAALAMGFVARKRAAPSARPTSSSWPAAMAAVGVRFLPDVLRLVGLAVLDDKDEKRAVEENKGEARPGPTHVRA